MYCSTFQKKRFSYKQEPVRQQQFDIS